MSFFVVIQDFYNCTQPFGATITYRVKVMEENDKVQELIRGALIGDRGCQQRLFAYYFPYAKAITLRYMGNSQEAEEALNDAFLKFFQGLSSYQADQPLKRWLRKILVNTCLDHLRVRKRAPRFFALSHSSEAGVEDALELDEREDLLPILRSLPPRYRAVFNLYVFEDYKHAEIAKLLGISEGTSKSNYARARKLLKRVLLENLEENSSDYISLSLKVSSAGNGF